MNDYDLAAYYWPAYHDEPRWRSFMPEGIGEWETIRKARPKFDGHRQPRVPAWGYADESDPAVMARKIDAAADHGVNVFIFDWYWYDNAPFLEEAVGTGFLGAPNNDRVRFYLMWANHDATTLWDLQRSHTKQIIWPGAVDRDEFTAATDRVIERFLGHPSYYRIDGRPVFCLYEIGSLVRGLGGIGKARAALDDFRARARAAGLPGLHLQGILWGRMPASMSMVPGDRSETQDNTVRALGLDSLTNYQWCHYVKPDRPYAQWAAEAIPAWDRWTEEFSVPFYPHVSVGWDTNPRFPTKTRPLVTEETPELFARSLRRAADFVDRRGLAPPLITVNAWNEWSEGSYLEPDTHWGTAYLDAVRAALKR